MQQRRRIAIVQQPWSIVRPGQTGADSVVLWTDEVSRRLARLCDVVCYSRAGEGLPATEVVDGVEHRRISGALDRYVKFAFRKLDQWGLRNAQRPGFASPLAYRQFVLHVARDLQRESVDIIHVHNTSQFIPILRQAVPEARIALQMHCEWLTQLDPRIVSRRIESADLVIGVSDFLAGKIRQRFPQFADRIRRVWNGADVERFAVDRRARPAGSEHIKRLLYVGRISPEKGIHTLLDAFAIVSKVRGDVRLRVIGPEGIVPHDMIVPFCDDPKVLELSGWFRGGYMDHLRAQAESLPKDRLEFYEREVPHPQLPQHYADADVFVFPSIWDEPFGLPLVEAMAAGLPCIATRGGAFAEIVRDGETGLLVDRDNPEALAAAIGQLCADDALRARLGAAARNRARELFSWDRVADALLAEYERLIPAPAHGVEDDETQAAFT